MLLVFCSFHITHNIQKPISSLLQDGANYSAKGLFLKGSKNMVIQGMEIQDEAPKIYWYFRYLIMESE